MLRELYEILMALLQSSYCDIELSDESEELVARVEESLNIPSNERLKEKGY